MQRTQIYLLESQQSLLTSLAQSQGVTKSDLIRRAVELFLSTQKSDVIERKNRIMGFAGMWADRDDTPNVRDLRDNADRTGQWSN